MTKKLLPTVIGMILAGGVAVAQADVQVMGHIDESINYINGGKVSGTSDRATFPAGFLNNSGGPLNYWPYVDRGDNNTQLVCTTCSVGFKGSEDLGNGLKALFFLDFQYDINNSSGLSGRDQYLGLGGNFGTLKFGTMSTVYKSYGAMIDPVYRTVAQQRDVGLQSTLHSGKGDEGEGRATNTVGYNSPDWNGLSLAATYSIRPDSEYPPAHENPYSVGAKYENGGLLGYVSYITNNTGSDDAATEVGVKYTLNNFAVFGQYEFDQGLVTDSVTNTLGQNNDGDGADVWMVGGTYTMGNNTLYAAYGQGSHASSSSTLDNNGDPLFRYPDYKAWSLVGIHSFSKRTLAYAGYVGHDLDGKVGIVGLGGNDTDAVAHFTLGMKHTF